MKRDVAFGIADYHDEVSFTKKSLKRLIQEFPKQHGGQKYTDIISLM